jgi:hypothetical protein
VLFERDDRHAVFLVEELISCALRTERASQ